LLQFERAEKFLPPEYRDERGSAALSLVVSEILAEELVRAEKRREKRAKLDALGHALSERGAVTAKAKAVLCSGSVLEAVLANTEASEAEESKSTASRFAIPSLQLFRRRERAAAGEAAASARILPYAAGFTAVLFLGLLFRAQLMSLFSTSAPLELAMNGEQGGSRPLLLPELLPRLGTRSSSDSFGELTKRLDNLSNQARRPAVPRQAPARGDSAEPPVAQVPDANGEPHYYDPEPRPGRTPELDAEKIAGTVVESLDEVRGTISREMRVGPDGRIYGPPPGPSDGANRSLDGSPMQPYEVKVFDRPVLYRTITSTNVLSAPSVLATAVARLESEATVQVTSRMGHWLEIESSGGRRGYIYAQNAVIVGH
jgi:hypothetical protein